MSGSRVSLRRGWTLALLVLSTVVFATSAAAANEARVTVGSPLTPFPQNKQNEPAVAIDASRPTVLAAGSNDEIDLAPCGDDDLRDGRVSLPVHAGVGVSGVLLLVQWRRQLGAADLHGLERADGTPKVGPIGTLPWYYENGLVADGDPAVAFGPIPATARSRGRTARVSTTRT